MADTRTLLAQILQGPAPARPWGVPASALDTTMTNPVGTSRVFPPQVLTNPSPAFSPMVGLWDMTREQRLGAMQTRGTRGRPPLASDLPALQEAGQQFLEDGMAVAGAVQPVGQGIRAFHGSPHKFDRFSLDNIGTGEGAQAYGHGLYFAGNEGVARNYRATLSGDPTIAGRPLNWSTPAEHAAVTVYSEGSKDAALRALTKEVKYLRGTKGFNEATNDAAAALRYLKEGGALPKLETPGSMYEVNLRTSPERLLDWDKPLSAQPTGVREALGKIGVSGEVPKPFNGMPLGNGGKLRIVEDADFGPRMFMDLAQGGSFRINESDLANLIGRQGGGMYGKTAYTSAATKAGGDQAATEALRKSGIDGIQYLDGGSRAAGEGSRNYVLFRDDIIEILRRYGLLGMIGGGAAATATQGDQ
jgi:hypothetical protein